MIQISRMIGPAVAGWLIGGLGVATAFWLNGFSFAAVIFSLLRVQADQKRQPASGKPLQDFHAGIQFINREPRIQDLMILTGYIYLFGFANTQIIPAFATDYLHGGPQTLGLLMGAFGAGALVSSIFVIPLVQRQRRIGLMLCGAVMWGGVWFGLFS